MNLTCLLLVAAFIAVPASSFKYYNTTLLTYKRQAHQTGYISCADQRQVCEVECEGSEVCIQARCVIEQTECQRCESSYLGCEIGCGGNSACTQGCASAFNDCKSKRACLISQAVCDRLGESCYDLRNECAAKCGRTPECLEQCEPILSQCQADAMHCDVTFDNCARVVDCDEEWEKCWREYDACDAVYQPCVSSCKDDLECIGLCDEDFTFCVAQGPFDDCDGDWKKCACECTDPIDPPPPPTTTPAPTTTTTPAPTTTTTQAPTTPRPPPECPTQPEEEESAEKECDPDPGSKPPGSKPPGSKPPASLPACSSEENDDDWDGDDPDDPTIKPCDPCKGMNRPGITYVPDLRNCYYYWACSNGSGYKYKCPKSHPVFDWRREQCVKGKRKHYCDRPFCGKQDKGKPPKGKKVHEQCKHYHQCLGGTIIDMQCPNGYSFDDRTERCEPDWLSDCLACLRSNKKHSVQYYPDRKDCNGYYVCSKGKFHEKKCCKGLHWNEKKQKCQKPKDANCQYEGYQTPRTPTAVYGASYFQMWELQKEQSLFDNYQFDD
jgi:hypothetical protein